MGDLQLATILTLYFVFLYSTVCHEAAHAWSAHKLGDDTAYRGGQVSLDPIPHIKREPFGMILVPLLSLFLGGFMIGWASAPYDPNWARYHPRRAAWMALAGPAANLCLAIIGALLIRVGLEWNVFEQSQSRGIYSVVSAVDGRFWEFCALLVSVMFSLNLILCVFNLLPIPPFDGASLPLLFLSNRAAAKYQEVMWSGALNLIGIIVAFNGFWYIYAPIYRFALRVLFSGIG